MSRKLKKSIAIPIKIIVISALLYLSVWLFNHVNPWLGIFSSLVIIIYLFNKLSIKMKNLLKMFVLICTFASLVSCERVAPNYAGVLMENFGKSGKEDFTIVTGRVNVAAPGTELFQVPLFDQRGEFETPTTLKAADNTEFNARPTYSYRVIKNRAIDIVFDNKHIGSGNDFMESLEDNILEPRIYDLIKEESRKHRTDDLMADGGSLMFEKKLEDIVLAEFEKRGLTLMTFSAQLEFSNKVKAKIDSRNEVNTNITVLDQQIEEQKKKNQLEELKTEQNLIRSRGLTDKLLQEQFIDKWDGKTPLYNDVNTIIKTVK